MSLESIIVTITPDRLREIQRLPVIPAHAVYRMGGGPTCSGPEEAPLRGAG